MEWVTKKLVASLINQWFGDFIEESCSQEINDSLLSGEVNLTNVAVKSNALSFLSTLYNTCLPIEVSKGVIGRISLSVPYASIFTQPLVITVQDVYLLVSPVTEYDQEKEKNIERERRKFIFNKIFPENVAKDTENSYDGLLGLLYNRIWNNLQLKIHGLHIRYEDTISMKSPIVIGFCVQSICAETTNQKWKKMPPEYSSVTISKILEVVSASVYINPKCDKQRLVRQHITTERWREFLQQGLNTFSINEEKFEFVVSPVRCKMKIRQHLEKEGKVPSLLVDAIVKEVVNIYLTHQQYVALLQLTSSFAYINLNKKFRKYRPEVPLKRHAKEWWFYAFNSIINEYLRSFSWNKIKDYRRNYWKYVDYTKRLILEQKNSELEADVKVLEDKLNVETIVVGRMHAKLEVAKKDPDCIQPVARISKGWLTWLFGFPYKSKHENDGEIDVIGARRNPTIFSTMSLEERKVFLDELKNLDSFEIQEKNKQDIDQKIYLSMKELNITLKDWDQKEIGFCIFTGIVFSLENRFLAGYRKVSFKVESFTLEGSNIEDDLVHIIKLSEGSPTFGYGVAMSIDFETKPLNGNEDYGVALKLDPVEFTYHQEAISKLLRFFYVMQIENFETHSRRIWMKVVGKAKDIASRIIQRSLLINFDIDINSPYAILPEYGSIQKGGNVLVIDLGGLKIKTEWGGHASNAEYATQMELEERLFDNLSITIKCLQVIFADSGDEWRTLRAKDDSELHLIPRVRIKTNLANNVYPELKEYPNQKIDIHVSPLKLNISENGIDKINEFKNNFPLLDITNFDYNSGVFEYATYPKLKETSTDNLNFIKNLLYKKIAPDNKPDNEIPETVTPELLRHVKNLKSFDTISQTSLELANYFPEESDDEIEKLSKPVDQLGFEDNTSPNNIIKMLFRLCFDEITLCISLFENQREVPYVMVTLTRCLIESALMEYGPAIQVTLGSIHLVDKYHHSISGKYLELLSSGAHRNVFSLLYRKVYANCPDFKSHFHSCEQSFVVDISTVHLVWQHSAINTLLSFLSECAEKLKWVNKLIISVYEYFLLKKYDLLRKENPPVPSGATKWSINGNLSKLTMNLCDSEHDLFHLKICGLTGCCVFKANDKYVLRITLTDLLLEDLSDFTLYNRIIEIEEDRVFEIKFVKYNPCFRGLNKTHLNEISCKSDFSLSIQIGRLQCVLLYKVFKNISQLISCVFSKGCLNYAYHYTENSISRCFHNFNSNKISISLQIHIPTFLVPQKSDSPSLLVFSFGDIKADNFFKSVSGSGSTGGTVENILFEIGPAEIYRAIMALTGEMELQEAILEPSIIRIDLKRSLMRPCRDVLSWDATINVNALYINLGQRDLNTILCILSQNKLEADSINNTSGSRPNSPINQCKIISKDDDCVDKLQDFLNRSVDIYRTSMIVIYLDSVHITLFNDMNEILSSPVRDSATALCKIEFGEIDAHADINNDNSLELKSTLQSLDIFDIRVESTNVIKKIFGQFSINDLPGQNKIRFNKPHLLDLSVRISPSGDLNAEISLDKTRTNLSMGLILALSTYISNSIPKDVHFPDDAHIITDFSKEQFNETEEDIDSSSSSCSTSGYLSTSTDINDDQRVLSVSFKAKLPELLFFVDPEETESRIFVLRFHVQGDYSKHPASEGFKIYFDKVTIFATSYSKEKLVPYIILPTSYFEASWGLSSCETETVTLLTSNIRFNICSSVVHMINEVLLEINESQTSLHPVEFDFPVGEKEDLWSPKPLQQKFIGLKNNKVVKSKGQKEISSHQKLSLKIHSLEFLFEKDDGKICPVFCIKLALNLEAYDWRKAFHIKGDIPVSILYFNTEFSCWEHVLDPIPNDTVEPVNLLIRALTFRGQTIGTKNADKVEKHFNDIKDAPKDRSGREEYPQNSDSSSEDDQCANSEMVILKPSFHNKQGLLKKGYSFESDSETEGNLLYKISSTFSHLFSSESDISEEEDSDDDTGEGTSDDVMCHENKGKTEAEMKEDLSQELVNKTEANISSEQFQEGNEIEGKLSHLKGTSSLSTLFIISCKDKINFSVTSKIIESFCDLYNDFFNSKSEVRFASRNDLPERRFRVINQIGPNSKVLLLYLATVDNPNDVEVLAEASFHDTTFTTSRPGSSLGGYSSEGSLQEKDAEQPLNSDFEELDLNISVREVNPIESALDDGSLLQIPNSMKLYDDITKHRIRIEVDEFEPLEIFVGSNTTNRIFSLHHESTDCRYYILVSVESSSHVTSVIVRSPFQVVNDLPFPVNICFKKSALHCLSTDRSDTNLPSPSLSIASLGSLSNPFEEYPSMVTLQPDQIYSVPLLVSYHSPLFLVPSATDYKVSEDGFWWKERQEVGEAKVITCESKNAERSPVSMNCILLKGVEAEPSNEENHSHLVPNFTLKIASHLRLFNYLPYTLVLQQRALSLPLTLDPGSSTSLNKIDPLKDDYLEIQVCNYQGNDWRGSLHIPIEPNELVRVLPLSKVEEKRGRLEVSVYVTQEATISIYVFCPYWIVNKTGLPLKVKGSKHKMIVDSGGSEEILLFHFKKNYPHKIKVSILESEWSRGWCCDSVGTCGVVICEDKIRNKKFRILAKHSLSTLKADFHQRCESKDGMGLYHPTKIICLMPYFLVKNSTSKAIMYMQESDKNGLWFDIGSNQCEAFWPTCDEMYLVVRRRESQVISQRFHINTNHTTLLRMEKGTALVVTVDGVGSDSPVMVTFMKYCTGDAPIRLENGCKTSLRFHQKNSSQVTVLAPQQSLLYTWDDPTLERELMYNIYGRKSKDFTAVINMDKRGSETIPLKSKEGKEKLLGRKSSKKRTRLRKPSSNHSSEESNSDLSEDWCIVNSNTLPENSKKELVIYWVCFKEKNQRVLFFTQSRAVANLFGKQKWVAHTEVIVSLEGIGVSLINGAKKEVLFGGIYPSVALWQIEVDDVWKDLQSTELCSWLEDQYCYNKCTKVNLKAAIQVDFEKMIMTTPFIGRLRRLKHPGVWIQFRKSTQSSYFKIRINAIQIDNQTDELKFPVVLSSNRFTTSEKPSIEFCLLLDKGAKNETTIRHVDLISKEIKVNLEKNFVLEVYDMFSPFFDFFRKVSIRSELKKLLTPLTFSAFEVQKSNDDGYQIERACFGGLHLTISYSMKRVSTPQTEGRKIDIIDGFFSSLGINLREFQNVTIKVSQMELEALFLSQVITELKTHFRHQLIQQIYVLILGLDILGNPYQRLRTLHKGVRDLVYNAEKGTIKRPDEFAEEISKECYKFCGHATLNRSSELPIFSSFLNLEIDQFSLHHRKKKICGYSPTVPHTFTEEIPFHWRMPIGITWHLRGRIFNVYTDTSQESVEYFLRNKGRALLELIINPCFGIKDPIAAVDYGIARSILKGHEVIFREQPTKHVSPYSPLKAINPHEVEGLSILKNLPQGFVATPEKYFGHAILRSSKHPQIFLSTLSNFYFLESYGSWGHCKIVWRICIRNLTKQPSRFKDTITFQIRQDETQYHLAGAVRLLQCPNADVLDLVMNIIKAAMTVQMQILPCPTCK